MKTTRCKNGSSSNLVQLDSLFLLISRTLFLYICIEEREREESRGEVLHYARFTYI